MYSHPCVSLFMVILTHELLCDYIFNFIRGCYYYEKMCRFPLGIRKQQLLFPMFFLMLDTADYCNKISTSGRQKDKNNSWQPCSINTASGGQSCKAKLSAQKCQGPAGLLCAAFASVVEIIILMIFFGILIGNRKVPRACSLSQQVEASLQRKLTTTLSMFV